jgi:UrcA family protein
MKTRAFALALMSGLALTASLTIAGGSAMAQQGNSVQAGNAAQQPAAAEEEVTVRGPRLVRSHVGGKTQIGGFGYDLVTLTHRVSYADLNLARPEHVKMLEDRIGLTARQICRELAKMFPVEAPNNPDCVRQATKGAMTQAHAAIAAAKNR